jgi:hypothetical protein
MAAKTRAKAQKQDLARRRDLLTAQAKVVDARERLENARAELKALKGK